MALATSCMSVFETTSNENSCAITMLNYFHARRRCEAKELRGSRFAMESREIELGAIAFAIGILQLLHQMRAWRDRHGDVADRRRCAPWLQRNHDRVAAL